MTNMTYLHFLMAILASWRITELMTQDRIMDKLRKRFPTYIWQCSRCMSMWAGIWTAAMFWLWPWVNWPFALAWIYLVQLDWAVNHRIASRGREFTVSLTQSAGSTQWKVTRNELQPQELHEVMRLIVAPPRTGNGTAIPPSA